MRLSARLNAVALPVHGTILFAHVKPVVCRLGAGREDITADAPAAFLIIEPRESVEHGIGIRADEESARFTVVRHVGDKTAIALQAGGLQNQRQACATQTAAHHGDQGGRRLGDGGG